MTLLSILGVLSSAIFSGTSLLYTTLGEVIDERAGIVNLGWKGCCWSAPHPGLP